MTNNFFSTNIQNIISDVAGRLISMRKLGILIVSASCSQERENMVIDNMIKPSLGFECFMKKT